MSEELKPGIEPELEVLTHHVFVVVERAGDLHNLGQWCMSTAVPELRCKTQLALSKALVLRLAKHLNREAGA